MASSSSVVLLMLVCLGRASICFVGKDVRVMIRSERGSLVSYSLVSWSCAECVRVLSLCGCCLDLGWCSLVDRHDSVGSDWIEVWPAVSWQLHMVHFELRVTLCGPWLEMCFMEGPRHVTHKGSRKRGRNPTWFHLMMSGIVLLMEVSCLIDSLVLVYIS